MRNPFEKQLDLFARYGCGKRRWGRRRKKGEGRWWGKMRKILNANSKLR